MVRDFYHRYTVDEHTLVAMQNACSAPASYGELLRELPQKGVLLFALLFHDAGKAIPMQPPATTGHVEASLTTAGAAMRRIRMPAPDRDTVSFLIRNHLELSSAMRSRDLADPKAIHDVAQIVGTEDRLKALTLLTYADISAVNPSVMTPWRVGPTVAALPGRLSRTDARTGERAHRGIGRGAGRGTARRFAGALSAYA